MKETFYKELHILDMEILKNNEQNSLLMCSSTNWEHYFLDNIKKANIETISNVVLVEFETQNEFDNYKKTDKFIDYSLEHKQPMVLSYV